MFEFLAHNWAWIIIGWVAVCAIGPVARDFLWFLWWKAPPKREDDYLSATINLDAEDWKDQINGGINKRS